MDKLTDQKTKESGFGALIVLILLAVLVVAGIFIYKSLSHSSNQVSLNRVANATPLSTATIQITGSGFNPSTIEIKKGTQITFTNSDSKQHQPASDPYPTHTQLPGFFSQDPLNNGDSYSFVFDKPGTFTYQDFLNPLKLKGTIIVTN